MSLADEYRQQSRWRDWPRLFAALPDCAGRRVYDLGCAIGDQSAELAARGARVIGIDSNAELLAAARARNVPCAEFIAADLRALPGDLPAADGIWCSFATAYFVDLTPVLSAWSQFLAPGGWIALTEIDDLFAHEPLGAATWALLDGYVAESLRTRRYDFKMGSKLADSLTAAGFSVEHACEVADREFAFRGPAEPDVVDAWRRRFERMPVLRAFCGADAARVRDEFLACLAHPDHRSLGSVRFCLATTGGSREARHGGR